MRIGILTYYAVHNHGALLQANALKHIVESKGYECGFLKFERDYSCIPESQIRKYKLGIGSIMFYIKFLIKKGIRNIFFNIRKNKILRAYRSEELPLWEEYNQFNDEMVIVGSDEIFSMEIGINPMLYGNGIGSKYVISYAGSFGPTTIENIKKLQQETMISKGLHRMNSISVRDKNSQNIVKEIANLEATLVCDPVILYGYKEEMQRFIPPIKDYILIYSYDKNMNNQEEVVSILNYAKTRNVKIVSVGFYHNWCKSINATPIELLGWINNANYVITDTFHGTVMSMICNTPMAVKLRGNNNKLQFLLSEYNLEDRIISDFSNLRQVIEKDINFTFVNAIIEEKRKISMNYLESALEII